MSSRQVGVHVPSQLGDCVPRMMDVGIISYLLPAPRQVPVKITYEISFDRSRQVRRISRPTQKTSPALHDFFAEGAHIGRDHRQAEAIP